MERALPPAQLDTSFPLSRAIALRRSVRSFSREPLTDVQIGQLFWACQGITDRGRNLRAAPSAGGIFPFKTYAVLAEGLFRYRPSSHSLRLVSSGDIRGELARAALGQEFVAMAPLTIGLAANSSEVNRHYGDRARRYTDMEAGHIAQNIHLTAVALGLGSVPVGAFDDRAVSRILDLPSNLEPLYLIPVGKPGT